eukprot:c41849_g1_i1 orf=3-185(-)
MGSNLLHQNTSLIGLGKQCAPCGSPGFCMGLKTKSYLQIGSMDDVKMCTPTKTERIRLFER